ncbi:MAG: GNAT family N-acetyltransferase [Chloroflexia bacterium]
MLSVASGLTVEIADSFDVALGSEEVPGIVTREEWSELLAASASDVVFMTWQWQALWWKHFSQAQGCRLHLLAVRGEGGALVGIAPLFVASEPLPPLKEYHPGELRPEGEGAPLRTLRLVGGIDIADYLDVIAAPEALPDVWSAVLDYLISKRNEWDVIDLHSLPADSPSKDIVPDLVMERGMECELLREDVCPVLKLPSDWDTYLMSLRKKDRHELRRKVRKLEGRDDSRWYLVNPVDTAALGKAMQIFIDLHRKSGEDKALFMDEQMAGFFTDMVHELAYTGWLDLAILDMDGYPAAAYFSFNYKKRIYLYNSGYEPRWASYSAGIALLAYRIHKAILQGIEVFDFLRGDEPYKYDFGAKDTYIYRAVLRSGKTA